MKGNLGKIILPTILLVLAYGFWISPDFKEIAAGVAIFLFGMLALEEGFKAFTGGVLEKVLKRTTDKLWKSLSFGVLSTTIMQSSSLVSVITISFLGAGLIGLAQGIGIIFGANLGTTTGAWLVAGFGLKVKISAYAMPMLVFGVILIFQKSRQLKGVGYILAGLGFLFLGIHHMKEGFETFKSAIDLAEYAVAGYPGLFLFTLIGIFATVVMQSSHATLVLIITALAAQQISYENALALAIGANVGTTITAILGSLSSNEQGKRLAGAHLIFNVVTGLIAIIFIHQFLAAVDFVSESVGIGADDYTLKLAVFHTLFNLVGVMVMIPLINHLVNFLERFIKSEPDSYAQPKYLNDSAIEFGDTAIEALRMETARIYDKATKVIAKGLSLDKAKILSGEKLKHVIRAHDKVVSYDIEDVYEHEIKSLCSAVLDFSNKLNVTEHQARRVSRIRMAIQSVLIAMKNLKHLQKNMLKYINSGNPHISGEYNRLRQRIAKAIRRLEKIRSDEHSSTSILSLDALKLTLEKNMGLLHERMDELIREGHISAEMAISLMNDSHYSYSIIHNLIQVNHNCLKSEEIDQSDAEHMIALNREEISSVLADNQNSAE
ncbi:phosphate:Na+ symporter [Mariprofundus ferrinatatus]|uniref:Phosphate:Na+ symporter n=1 Tax=Mariprofundus ferrinatatus TaxID=1921087 RepID=A0A2K8L5I1_9PROT|nr:Na/Pi cotransporter family protein [Mariprofundus ferrinatatus]ATX81499.1 phosphate:Na+ symporter [Mariprofundus ferrinatatus]